VASHRLRKFEAAILAHPQPILLLGLVQHVVGKFRESEQSLRAVRFERVITTLPPIHAAADEAIVQFELIARYDVDALEWEPE
jgi:hypothetical protein